MGYRKIPNLLEICGTRQARRGRKGPRRRFLESARQRVRMIVGRSKERKEILKRARPLKRGEGHRDEHHTVRKT